MLADRESSKSTAVTSLADSDCYSFSYSVRSSARRYGWIIPLCIALVYFVTECAPGRWILPALLIISPISFALFFLVYGLQTVKLTFDKTGLSMTVKLDNVLLSNSKCRWSDVHSIWLRREKKSVPESPGC